MLGGMLLRPATNTPAVFYFCSASPSSVLRYTPSHPTPAGTPGLPDAAARAERAARDDSLAAALRIGGLPAFLEHWYQQPMWAPLRSSPRCVPAALRRSVHASGQTVSSSSLVCVFLSHSKPACHHPWLPHLCRFAAMLQQRQAAGDAAQLAAVLAAASPGRAPSMWHELEVAAAAGSLPPLLLVAGQADSKFVGIAEKLAARLAAAGGAAGSTDEDEEGDWHAAQLAPAGGDSGADAFLGGCASVEVALLPSCGHAPHIERPVELLAVLQRFLGCR